MEDLIKALTIFLKYGNPRNPTWCIHDELHIAHVEPSQVSDEDKAALKALGFLVDEETESFYSFRYGSA